MSTEYFDLLKSPLNGKNLIEASAGTGKTYIIAGLFLRLIIEKGLPIDKILAVTYTEAATEELRYRIRNRLKEALDALKHAGDYINNNDELLTGIVKKYGRNEAARLRLKDALTRFDEASICTIHGFCRRMLAENAFESNSLFNAELITDQSGLIREISDDFWRKNFYSASPLLIRYAGKKGIGPLYFLKLFNYQSIDPSFRIIPQLERPDLAQIEKRFMDVYKELGNEWSLCRSEIEDILLTHKGLNRTKYGIGYLPIWIIEMDNYLSFDNPVMIFNKFEKFTGTSINASIKNGFDAPRHVFFDLTDKFYKIYNTTISSLNDYIISLEAEFFEFMKNESGKRKQNLNILSFDDLLINMHKALSKGVENSLARTIRARYSAALIDEFQDTDPVQYDIFNMIFGTGNHVLFLIGDPKQSVYKFRGADIFAYLKASAGINSSYTLGTNWRSSPGLVNAVNTIFKSKTDPFVLKEIEFNALGHADADSRSELAISGRIDKALHIWAIDKDDADMKDDTVSKRKAEAIISNAVAGEILNLVSMGMEGTAMIGDEELKPGHIAVLVRKRHQAKIVQQELARFNIPGVLYGTGNIFASHEALEMERVIAAIADPGDERRLKAALASDMMGLSGNEIFQLAENESSWEEYLNRFYEYNELWLNNGFFRMFGFFADNEGIRGRLLSYMDGERRMTNILHLAELLHRAEIENKLGIESLIKWLGEKRASPDESDEHEIRLETDEDAVKLITIHRSKGLEFPVVFCPFTWENPAVESGKPFAFHDPDNHFNLTLDLGTGRENNISAARTEELAESTRLLYVALTRAKHRSYLFWGRINETWASGLSYILHYRDKDMPADPAAQLMNSVKFMSYEAMLKDIRDIAEASGNSISVRDMPQFEYRRFIRKSPAACDLKCRIFNAGIRKDWKVSSFSALTYGRREDAEDPDYDSLQYPLDQEQEIKNMDNGIFSFPRGANSGTCIHEILEKSDFTDFKKDTVLELINAALVKYGIDPVWLDAVFDMVFDIIKKPLLKDRQDLVLNRISCRDRLNELEFYFPLNLITPGGLADVFYRSGISIKDFPDSIEKLGFIPHRGYVKGYIDMVFQYNGKFYIIDWKSNYMGDSIQDYSFDKIQTAMKENYYILQYYIYTLALHRYLSIRKKGYDYDRHFGGVFYVFVRGTDAGYGVYHDVPSKYAVESLGHYLAELPEEVL